MIVGNYSYVAGAVLSLAVAFQSGKEAVVAHRYVPSIEGTAVYAETVTAGGEIILPWSIRKTTDCPGTFTQTWSGSDGFWLVEASRPATLPMSEGFMNYEVQTHIPNLAPSGALEFNIHGFYDCGEGKNPFRLGPVALVVGD